MSIENRYAAKLLFQFRVGRSEDSKFRTCEERIVIVNAKTMTQAYRSAERVGRQGQTRYKNDEGEQVHFEYIGVLDLMELGIEAEENEVWYEVKTLLQPMERKNKLIKSVAEVTHKKAGRRSGREPGAWG
jgi:hypothetical protein